MIADTIGSRQASATRWVRTAALRITLNGDPYDLAETLTISQLLATLDIDPRGVAVEHNLNIVKRVGFDSTEVRSGDQVEIVNLVGGG